MHLEIDLRVLGISEGESPSLVYGREIKMGKNVTSQVYIEYCGTHFHIVSESVT